MTKKIEIHLGPPPTRRSLQEQKNNFSTDNPNSASEKTGQSEKTGPPAALLDDPNSMSASVTPPRVNNPAAPAQRSPAAKKISESNPPQRVGRKPDPTSSLPRVFDSIAQCSAITGIPVAALREAKKAGCPAFRHGRVDISEFLKWRFGLPEDAVSDWGERLKQYKAEREKIALDKDRDIVADRSTVTTAIGKAMAVLFSTMDRSFGNTLPPALKGLSETEIQQRLLAAGETFKQAVRTELQNFVNKTNQPPTESKT